MKLIGTIAMMCLIAPALSLNIRRGNDRHQGTISAEADCQACAEEFDRAGGCAAMHEKNERLVHSLVPQGCSKCGEKAKDYCGLNTQRAGASGASGATGGNGDRNEGPPSCDAIFQIADKSGDSKITKAEAFEAFGSEPDFERVFAAADADGNGSIDMRECEAAFNAAQNREERRDDSQQDTRRDESQQDERRDESQQDERRDESQQDTRRDESQQDERRNDSQQDTRRDESQQDTRRDDSQQDTRRDDSHQDTRRDDSQQDTRRDDSQQDTRRDDSQQDTRTDDSQQDTRTQEQTSTQTTTQTEDKADDEEEEEEGNAISTGGFTMDQIRKAADGKKSHAGGLDKKQVKEVLILNNKFTRKELKGVKRPELNRHLKSII